MVTSVGHHCSHDNKHIKRDQDDCYLVSMQLQGAGSLYQDDRLAIVKPGEMVFYDSTRPFDWDFDSAFRQLVVRIPRESFRYRLPSPQECTARTIYSGQGMGKLVSGYLNSLIEGSDTLDDSAGRFLANGTIDLLAGMLAETTQRKIGSQTNIQAFHLNRAYVYIADNVRRADLSPDEIAQALNISVRYLHRLFLTTESSVGRHILQMRLDGCAAHLIDPRRAGLPISSIAYEWGFDNAAHFSRSFRARFGMSAREYRSVKSVDVIA